MTDTSEHLLPRDVLPPEWLTRERWDLYAGTLQSHTETRPRNELPGQHAAQTANEFKIVKNGLWNQLTWHFKLERKVRDDRRAGLMAVENCLHGVGGLLLSNTIQLSVLQRVANPESSEWQLEELRQDQDAITVLAQMAFAESAVKIKGREGSRWPRMSRAKLERRVKRVQALDDEHLKVRASASRERLVQRNRNLHAHINSVEPHPYIRELVYEYITGEPLNSNASETA